ncbi:uncharacterized protein C8A04DRAFT_31622 [Dichotomopilus funicola]|uniref:Uncharacterized protein n=1 Tax=Dichotomopilus funicola TaxID=1934379 RepID=A0AAN6UYJ2_9PEZI|nr:hypothetical protein C8A04DRAFT_31622 [Dichotomopilus funicola]
MGPHPQSKAHAEGHYTYTLVYRGGPDPGQIYVDTGDYGLRRFLFETPLPTEPSNISSSAASNDHTRRPKGLPTPSSPPCFPLYNDEAPCYFIFYSSANMYGVAEVTFCRTERGTISGIVLRYHDGRQESLGQVRPDKLASSGATLRVEDPVRTPHLWFRLDWLGGERPFTIAAVTLDPPSSADWPDPTSRYENQWYYVPWNGTLEW